jgi:hypothetical protein
MKKLMVLMLLLIALLTISQATLASTTLFLGKTFAGNGTSNDYGSPTYQSNSANISDSVIDFTDITEIKKIKIDVDYEFGDFNYNSSAPTTLGLWDSQVGFPAIVNDKGLVYVTVGTLNYTEYSQANPKHEVNGYMLGLDLICTPTDKFQFEIDLQHSCLGSTSKLSYGNPGTNTLDSTPDLTALKVKLQYTLTDNFGLAVHYRLLDYKVKNPADTAVNMDTTSLGLIYRF